MRTGLFLLAGFLLLAASLILARLFSQDYPASTTWATVAFLLLWLALTGVNLWVGCGGRVGTTTVQISARSRALTIEYDHAEFIRRASPSQKPEALAALRSIHDERGAEAAGRFSQASMEAGACIDEIESCGVPTLLGEHHP